MRSGSYWGCARKHVRASPGRGIEIIFPAPATRQVKPFSEITFTHLFCAMIRKSEYTGNPIALIQGLNHEKAA
jgi:hypothetical protein